MFNKFLSKLFAKYSGIPTNPFHPMVWILGSPSIGKGVYIGGFSEVNATGATVTIGANADIASFVTINCADSHEYTLGITRDVVRKDIHIGENVFIGSHSVIKGGANIGHHSVVAAGTVVDAGEFPPFSLLVGNPLVVKPGYYQTKING